MSVGMEKFIPISFSTSAALTEVGHVLLPKSMVDVMVSIATHGSFVSLMKYH